MTDEYVEVVCVPQPPVRMIVTGNLEDFIRGEKMECDNYKFNMCPAVGGNEKICPNCEHKEWVAKYKLAIELEKTRDVSREVNRVVKAMYNKHGLKAFSIIKEDAETSLDEF